MPLILRPPRNTICGACYEGAKSVITLMNKLESDETADKATNSLPSSPNPYQTLTDIQLKPGNDGPSIPAHRALLAARSEIFKNMLDSDAYKAPASDTIMLPELNHQELESLLEFLYSGSLPSEKLEKHVYSLTLAADKYDIPYLLKFCERHMLRFLNSSNALHVLEIADTCSNKTLKETALSFIVKNMEDVVFSTKYEAFVPENPHLAVQVTRALLMDVKNRRNSGV
ncbi:hypothetical protein POTOM_044307 [Populus tomentosa]|uniref:BTB domain-containing protein n=1 Tax=Populus tomentosa TaxID=118781 RepID=A0A8X7YP86_POPTO|nr:hypothetical protein POTOM_044307 [Populus tomentosa]